MTRCRRGWVPALITLLALGLGTASAADTPRLVAGEAMGMRWSVKWIGPPLPATVTQTTTVWLATVERQLSTYRPESELARFNAQAGTNWFAVPPLLARAVELSLELGRQTGGVLDPTVFPLVRLWGFGPDRRLDRWPTEGELARARRFVGADHLQLRPDPPALRKAHPAVALDVNAVAMGLAADHLAAQLRTLGATNALIDLGGELAAWGPGPAGAGWPVGIATPGPANGPVAHVVTLRDQCLATSGNDRNVRQVNGRWLHHLIDPRTGRPAELPVASATVVHASCARADGWATALLILGQARAEELAREAGLTLIWLSAPAAPGPDQGQSR